MTTDWFLFRSETSPDNTAIITADDSAEYTYGHIHTIACKGASYFQSKGLKKGDRLAIMAYNGIAYIYLFSIAQKLGIVLVPINYRLTDHEVTLLLAEIQPKYFLHDDFNDPPPGTVSSINLTHLLKEIRSHATQHFNPPELLPEDHILILYTSGSSGVPKGVLYTYKMMFWNSINTMLSININARTSTIVCMPPFHTGGWNVLLTPLIHLGGTSILMQKFDAEEVIRFLEKYRCSVFMAVPTMLKMMAAHPHFKEADLSALDYIIVGGEAMPVSLIEKFHEKGVFIRQGYGMTEAGPNLTSLHEKDAMRKIGSIGKPNMYVEIRIRSKEDREAEVKERGELQIKGPMTMQNYFNKPQETTAVLKDGWLSTGDIAIRDKEGFIYIVDRIKNMFISGGENVYPAEVERIIKSHPSVSEVIVIPRPDPTWGESGMAVLSLQTDHHLQIEDLQTFCRTKLSKYKIPKELLIMKELPKNDAGKLDRKKVKEWVNNRK